VSDLFWPKAFSRRGCYHGRAWNEAELLPRGKKVACSALPKIKTKPRIMSLGMVSLHPNSPWLNAGWHAEFAQTRETHTS
jgi:hypothetical protein